MFSGLVLGQPLVHPTWLPNKRKNGRLGFVELSHCPPPLRRVSHDLPPPQSPRGPFGISPLTCPQSPPREARAAAWSSGACALQGLGPGRGARSWGGGRGSPPTITSRSPLVMDSSSTRNCKSSTFLQGKRGLSGLGSGPWASAQGGQRGAQTTPESRFPEPPGNLSPSQLLAPCSAQRPPASLKRGHIRQHPSSLGWLWDQVAGWAWKLQLQGEQSARREGGRVGFFPC